MRIRPVARRPLLGAGAVLGAALLVALPAGAASADVDDFSFASLDAQYVLTQDAQGVAHAEVTETFVADFPQTDQNRGIVRDIPIYYLGVDTDPQVESVTDAAGDDVPYEADRGDEFLSLALGTDDYVHGEQTYVIRYSIEHVVGHYRDVDDDEFYWDVNGTGWSQPFGEVSATVEVSPDIASALTDHNACYYGAQDSTTRCEIASETRDDGTVVYTAQRSDLAAHENMTVAIGFATRTFAQGTVTEPTHEIPAWVDVASGVVGAGALALLVVAIVARVRRRLAAPRAGFIVPQYEAPEGVDVMVASHLVGRGATAVPAALVDLAVKRRMRILDYPTTPGSGALYTLQYLDASGLDERETSLMRALFGPTFEPGELRELAPHDVALGAQVNAVATSARLDMTRLGLVRRQGYGCLVPALGIIPVVLAVALDAVASSLSHGELGPIQVVATLGAVVLLVATGIVALTGRQTRTVEGQRVHDHLEGMRLYLTVAEEERMRVLQSPQGARRIDVGDTKQIVDLYEKLLPWAVLWGVEKDWARELQVRVAQAGVQPDWYLGRSGFDAIAFASVLHGVASTTTYTPPSSSSGSGSGSSFSSFGGGSFGGGFSGGGGGGGGGGGR